MKDKVYIDEFKERVLKEADETGNMTLVARNNKYLLLQFTRGLRKQRLLVRAA